MAPLAMPSYQRRNSPNGNFSCQVGTALSAVTKFLKYSGCPVSRLGSHGTNDRWTGPTGRKYNGAALHRVDSTREIFNKSARPLESLSRR